MHHRHQTPSAPLGATRMRWSLLLLLAVLGLAGCKVDSIHPISAIDATQPDPALHGLWLPSSSFLDDRTVDDIAAAIRQFYQS